MSIAGSLHYWFVLLFLQFAPAGEVSPGRLIRYSLFAPDLKADLVFRVQEGSTPDSLRYQSLLAIPGRADSRFRARMDRNEAGAWVLKELIDNGRPLLAAGETLSLPTADSDHILISTDRGYVFQRVSGATRLSCLGFVVPGVRRARFEEGRNSVALEVHSRRGLESARIEFFEPRLSGRIVRVR